MDRTIYNGRQIVSIEVVDAEFCYYFEYRPAVEEKRFLGFKIRDWKPETWEGLLTDEYTRDSLPKEYRISHNNEIIRKPHVVLRFSNGDSKVINFDFYEEAVTLAESIKKAIKTSWIDCKPNQS